jgi:hypothetical protein
MPRYASGATPYDPARLARLLRRLEALGVAVQADDEGERLARTLGAEALYIPEVGQPGILVLAASPSCAAVYEELIHIGQHRRRGWGDVSAMIPPLELEAQWRMLRRAERWGWPEWDIGRLERAWDRWEGEYGAILEEL